MKVEKVSVQNFKSIKEAVLNLDSLTVLVGPNGAGKSTFLQALDIFYDEKLNISKNDFYNKDVSQPIVITLTFSNLSEEEKYAYKQYIQDNKLIIEKEIFFDDGKLIQKYYGKKPKHEPFNIIREAGNAQEKKANYREVRASHTLYSDLPQFTGNFTLGDLEKSLKQWEISHLDQCIIDRDDGNFFGFNNLGEAKLSKYTRFKLIPAQRDANKDGSDGKGSPITELINIVVRNELGKKEEYIQLKEETERRYLNIIRPDGGSIELDSIGTNVESTLSLYAPGAKVKIDWSPKLDIQINLPNAEVELEEEGYSTSIDHVGHGLQRAFIFSILQTLLMQQIKIAANANALNQINATPVPTNNLNPSIFLAIEEVELYQHPSRQRHISRTLLDLTSDSTASDKQIQLIYTTHSPLFIDLERFDNIRLIKRVSNGPDSPKITSVYQTNMDTIVSQKERIENAPSGSYTVISEKARLKTLMTPWTNEGFFSKKIVLVEGEEDRAAIIGISKLNNIDLEKMDISVIPCNGKTSILKAALIFNCFNIPIYAIWDGDRNKGADGHPKDNRALLKFFSEQEEDFPDTKIGIKFTCFVNSLTDLLKNDIGEEFYNTAKDEIRNELGYSRDREMVKNPLFIEKLLERANASGRQCIILTQIVNNIRG